MPSEKKESSPLITTSAIALALAGLAYVLYQPPLESVRPGAAYLKGMETKGDERVQSRLWQDPFLAVTDHQKAEKELDDDLNIKVELRAGIPLRVHVKRDKTDEHHQISRLARTFEEKSQSKVIMVITAGSSSAEGHETRLRDRNAVLSALGVACFTPDDAEHIRYFTWPNLSIPEQIIMGKEEVSSNYLKFVPYEWFDQRMCKNGAGKSRERVFVLWFQEDDLGDHPLKTLSDVWAQIIEELKEKPKPDLVILGPRSSSGLRTMAKSVLNESNSLFKGIDTVNMWSPWATVDDELLVLSLGDLMKKEMRRECLPQGAKEALTDASTCVKKIFKNKDNKGVTLLRTIPSDKMLVEALFEELRKRDKMEERPEGVPANNKKRNIAIVSEWDTFFGRSLPIEFRRQLCVQRRELKCKFSMEALKTFVEHPELDEDSGVFWYTYLRGLDGKVPGKDQDQIIGKGKDKEVPTLKESIRSIELGEMERPIGESQLDYTRRLAGVILETDQRLKDACGLWERLSHQCGGIEAIGITGSDMYDKFLVLQALRQKLPEKVFFTTDMDERYTDPEQIKWTRNLIVASHFGLRLEKHIQLYVPPFRDSYQTSAFYAVLRAMDLLHCSSDGGTAGPCGDSELKSSLDQSLVYDPKLTVRLYEIGNKDAVPIGRYQDRDYDERKRFLHEFLPPQWGGRA